jgi:cysteine desulfuration protein SufE
MNQPTIEEKIDQTKKLFIGRSSEEKIHCLLNLGRGLPPYPNNQKIAACRVSGCQSILYVSSHFDNGRVFFIACADALISAGLASLLISIYSGESPETILKTPPDFLLETGLFSTLTPSRSNGLAHIHQRIKKDAVKFLLSTTKSMELNSLPL